MLKVQNLQFAYGEKALIRGVSFSAQRGEILALIGLSGSGKTTLFKLINGLINPSQGEILIDGKSHPAGGVLTTFMRQDDLLLPWRTVMENLCLLAELGVGRKVDPLFFKHAQALLTRMGLTGYENCYPNELSGGMRQRVSLARALLQNRPLLLLDEPFASLDVILREELYTLLREIRAQYGKTILMVTHDFRDAIALADRLLILKNGKIASTYPVPSNGQKGHTEELIDQIRSDLKETQKESAMSSCISPSFLG